MHGLLVSVEFQTLQVKFVMFVEINEGKYVFERLKIVFDGLINFGLFEGVLVFFDVLFHVGRNLFDIGQAHVGSNKAFDHLVVEEEIHQLKIYFFLQLIVIFQQHICDFTH